MMVHVHAKRLFLLYLCVWHKWSGNYWKCVSSESRCAVSIWCNCMPAMQFLCRNARRYFSMHVHAWPGTGPGCTRNYNRKRNWTLPGNRYELKRNVMLCIYRCRNKWCVVKSCLHETCIIARRQELQPKYQQWLKNYGKLMIVRICRQCPRNVSLGAAYHGQNCNKNSENSALCNRIRLSRTQCI